ncbi:MAG: hypothetical protein FWD38_10945 [Oscillospiraceae bacterium]|nr:hypothetical protein [Oscillospiraceae bacterium]
MNPVLITQVKKLTKRAKNENKILHVSEAFKIYPSEAKIDNGKIEYTKKEESKDEV